MTREEAEKRCKTCKRFKGKFYEELKDGLLDSRYKCVSGSEFPNSIIGYYPQIVDKGLQGYVCVCRSALRVDLYEANIPSYIVDQVEI